VMLRVMSYGVLSPQESGEADPGVDDTPKQLNDSTPQINL